MAKLRIADLLAHSPVDPEAHLDEDRVRRYAADPARLPPVVVFDTPQGLLLADGYHRVAAARRAGAELIEAEVRRGTRADAMRHAVTVAAAERGISLEEASRHLQRRSSPGGQPPASPRNP
jgi:ParB-like chromosome segregation protein Spo0J